MCKSCFPGLNRREFVVGGSLTASLFSTSLLRAIGSTQAGAEDAANRDKTLAVVKVVFLYPLPEDCDQGKAEAPWQEHRWHPYPGDQYGHAEQQNTFTEQVRAMGERIGMQIDFAPKVLTTDVAVDQYIAEVSATPPDAMLVFCLS